MQKLVKKPLNNIELMQKLGGDVNIVTYRQLMGTPTLQMLFKRSNNVILFYEHPTGIGHWTCLFRDHKGIHYFDSYGKRPDQGVDFKSPYLKSLGITYPRLTYLLIKSGLPVEYFPYPMQNKGDKEATCGRWCLIRLLFKNLADEEFYELFKNRPDLTSDELSVILTECL